ncbi:ABC transporter permease [Campylobacter helveticus]|uniref:ABC transporter permease n=1 Tax=Campylobacter helveticus TaxID=28898 RepID=UPI001111CE49|nr:ABC transporter permease [Campylobacter helveticus]TNB56993.1 ABC transporter permease [Campylobacter helveticus]
MFKRLIFVVFIAFFSTFLCFVMLHFGKGSIAYAKGTNTTTLEAKERLEKSFGLDEPLLKQYGSWLSKALRGDFGISLIHTEDVFSLIKERFLNTMILSFSSLFILFFTSLMLGILCLLYENSFLEKLINVICMSFFALPSFALALVFILFFGAFLQILPSSGTADIGFEDDMLNRITHLIMPVSVLVLSHLAVFTQVARTSLFESHEKVFILNAYARGLSQKRIILHFTLKHALSPVISYFGACALSFMMSAYVIESVFSYGGLGNLMIESIIFKDYPVVLALVLVSVLLAGVFTFLADLICVFLNPRLKGVD